MRGDEGWDVMTMNRTYNQCYDAYAPVYDAIGQGRFGAELAERVCGWLVERGARVEHVLDLACGTGAASLVLAAAGCQVLGVDRSAAMLAIAQARVRDAGVAVSFVQSDLRDLVRFVRHRDGVREGVPQWIEHEAYDVATCFSDSMNYLTGDGDLLSVFTGVAHALRPGGYLVFDMNTEAEFATWDGQDVVTYDGHDYLVYNQLDYDAATRVATGRIVWFVREIERWWRGEEIHWMRAWSDADVFTALMRAGLDVRERLSPEGYPAALDAPRVVYVAQKRVV